MFIPTAGSCFDSPYWVDRDRQWLIDNGFRVHDLELVGASVAAVVDALANAELVYVAGGNTYFLLQHMQQTKFWDAMANFNGLYIGVSAGAIVACPDVAYIADLDDRAFAPNLVDTTGAGLFESRILPHFDDPRFRPKIDRILNTWPPETPVVKLNDDQAVLLDEGRWQIVSSPAGPLAF